MSLGCSVCGRNDKFVRHDSLCILHCDKTDWKVEGHWDVEKVASFWEVLRETKSQNSEGVFNFKYISFPPFQANKSQKTYATYADFTHSVATEDFSFWKKGERVAFMEGADFSFARFYEGMFFENVYMHLLIMQKAYVPYINLQDVKIERAHLKALSCKTLHASGVTGKSFIIQNSSINKLHIQESELERLQLIDANVVNMNMYQFKSRRLRLHQSQIKLLEIAKCTIDVVTAQNTKLQETQLDTNKLVTVHIQDSKLYACKLMKSRMASMRVENSQVYKSMHVDQTYIEQFVCDQTHFSKTSALKIQDSKLKELSLTMMQLGLMQWDNVVVRDKVAMSNVVATTTHFKGCDFKEAELNFERIQLNIQDAKTLELGKVSKSRVQGDAHSFKEWFSYYKAICKPIEWQQFLTLYERKKKDERICYQKRFTSVVELQIDHIIRYEIKSLYRKIKNLIMEKQICLRGGCA